MIGDKPACVWWVWPDNAGAGEALHRHLRGLNMVEIPGDRFDVSEAARTAQAEAVLFRHADADVMAAVLPLFDQSQISRVFGDASGILVHARDVCGVRLFERPATLPPAPRGMLRIRDNDQYLAIAEAQTHALRNRAVREFSPRLEGDSDKKTARIQSAFDRAESYGLGSQEWIWQFIEIDCVEGAGFEKDPKHADLKALLEAGEPDGLRKLSAIREAFAKRAPENAS